MGIKKLEQKTCRKKRRLVEIWEGILRKGLRKGTKSVPNKKRGKIRKLRRFELTVTHIISFIASFVLFFTWPISYC